MLGWRISRVGRALLAVTLLAALYWAADWGAVGNAIAELRPGYVMWALLLFVPQTLISAGRWRWLAAEASPITFAQALRHTLAAAALNLVVPGKLGDLSKGAMLPSAGVSGAQAGGLVVMEKGFDVAALLVVAGAGWCGLGSWGLLSVTSLMVLVAWGGAVWGGVRMGRWLGLASVSGLLWTCHMMQVEWFLYAAEVEVASSVAMMRLPWAVFAGLLPVSLWGVGTRDAALVWLFADRAPAATLAVVGMLTALRYLVPGACGILCVVGEGKRSTARLATSDAAGRVGGRARGARREGVAA